MGQRQKEVQVGLTVILSVIVLVVGMLWLKQYRFAGGDRHYQVDFPAVDGLQVGDRVQVRGIGMGKVASLRIDNDQVRIGVNIDRNVSLGEDAEFRLQTVGIVGEKVVEVRPGAGKPVPDGYLFKGIAEPSLSGMSADAGRTLKAVDELATDLRDLVRELRAQGHLTGTLASAQSTLQEADTTLSENRANVRTLLADLRASAGALRAAVAGPDSGLSGALGGTRRTLTRADSALVVIEKAASTLLTVADRLEQGRGTAGKLLQDDRLYDEATAALKDLRDVIQDFKRNPRRYIKVSVF